MPRAPDSSSSSEEYPDRASGQVLSAITQILNVEGDSTMFLYVVCGIALIIGVLLCFMGKKFMRVIISLLAGLAAMFGVLLIFQALDSSAYGWDSFYGIVGTCVAAGLLVMFIAFKWFVIKLAFGLLGGFVFAFGFVMAFHVSQQYDTFHTEFIESHHCIIRIVIAVVGGLVGGTIGVTCSKTVMKCIGAVSGSFFIVSSVAFFIENFKPGTRTHFNLITIVTDMKRAVKAAEGMCAGTEQAEEVLAGQGERFAAAATDSAFLWMLAFWALLCMMSLVYQFCIQKSSKDKEVKQRVQNTSLCTNV